MLAKTFITLMLTTTCGVMAASWSNSKLQEMVAILNSIRGPSRPQLCISDKLMSSAKKAAQLEAQLLQVTTDTSKSLGERIYNEGFISSRHAECIGDTTGVNNAEIASEWNTKPTEKAKIQGDYTHVGVWAERGSNGMMYWAVHFARVPPSTTEPCNSGASLFTPSGGSTPTSSGTSSNSPPTGSQSGVPSQSPQTPTTQSQGAQTQATQLSTSSSAPTGGSRPIPHFNFYLQVVIYDAGLSVPYDYVICSGTTCHQVIQSGSNYSFSPISNFVPRGYETLTGPVLFLKSRPSG